jgi:hypothetical protein
VNSGVSRSSASQLAAEPTRPYFLPTAAMMRLGDGRDRLEIDASTVTRAEGRGAADPRAIFASEPGLPPDRPAGPRICTIPPSAAPHVAGTHTIDTAAAADPVRVGRDTPAPGSACQPASTYSSQAQSGVAILASKTDDTPDINQKDFLVAQSTSAAPAGPVFCGAQSAR